MSDVALYEVDGPVATITMNRPDRMNSLTLEMLDLLPELLRRAAADAAVRVIVLTGAGERAFSAGADVAAAAERHQGGGALGLEGAIDRLQRHHETSILLHTLPKPTIAAVNGAAAGASLSMAFACDFRLAAEDALLRTAFAGIAFSGDFGSSFFLTQMVGSAKARELMMLAEKVSAAEALRLGLVTRVFPRASFRADVREFALRLAEGPPLSYRYMKRNLNLAESGAHLRDVLDLEAEAMMRTARSEDFAAGTSAFLKKEKAVFKGR